MANNKIICVEGVWGSGKTSTIHNIQNAIAARGESFAYISDEDESYIDLFQKTDDVQLFLSCYQKDWHRLISQFHRASVLILECGLFTGLAQHWLEHEMPVEHLLDYMEGLWGTTTKTRNASALLLTPKNMDDAWRNITMERGPAWTEYVETNILSDTNLNRKNKYSSVLEYMKDLDLLNRKIFSRLHKSSLQVETAAGAWDSNLRSIFDFLALKISTSMSRTGEDLCGDYECKGKTCEVRNLGNCLQIKNIFGREELILYLYSNEFPIIINSKVEFRLPSFGKVNIRFLNKNSNLVFHVSDVVVENKHFEKQFRLLDNTIWEKNTAA